MGQYYYIVNLDKKEFLHPHRFDDGLKLREFGLSRYGTMTALSMLLADGNGRGGGDWDEHPLIGSWAGDRIVISGDYSDNGKFMTYKQKNKAYVDEDGKKYKGRDMNLHNLAGQEFEDVSVKVLEVMTTCGYVRETLVERGLVNEKTGKIAKTWEEKIENQEAFDKKHGKGN